MSATFGFLPPDDLHCWFFEMERFDVAALGDVLSPDERARALQFHFDRDRNDYVVCRGVLRYVLATYLETDAASLHFGYSSAGKPHLHEARGTPLAFNLAHTHDAAVIALAWGRPVGVDLERVRVLDDLDGLVAHHFALEERAEHTALPETQRLLGFYAGWTRKEALLKATGEGLSRSLQSFAVTISPDERAPTLVRDDDASSDAVPWTIEDISPGAGLVAALAVRGKSPAICRNPLLPSMIGLPPAGEDVPGALDLPLDRSLIEQQNHGDG